MMGIRILLIFFCIALTSNTSASGELNYHYRYLTINEGLPQNTVYSILKDQFGFMWFATGNGLSRYDGHNFVNYWKPDLPSNLIHALAECANNRIWIGTSQGLSYYDQEKEEFGEFSLSHDFRTLNVLSLFIDKLGRIWVGTSSQGLFMIEVNDDGDYVQQHWNSQNSVLASNHVPCFVFYNDKLLIGTNAGIYVYSDSSNSLYEFEYSSPGSSLILSMYVTLNGDLWIGTFNGVWVYNPETELDVWYAFNPSDIGGLSHSRVNHITQDRNGVIYISTLGGVDIFQPETNTFTSLPYKTPADFSLNSIFINLIYIDDQGNIWIGTEKGGVNQISLYQKPFNHLMHKETNPNSLSESTVNSIQVYADIVWIGTAGGGLNKFFRNENRFEHYRFDANDEASIPSDYVTSILRTPDGDLWVGTWGGGIAKRLSDGNFQRYIPVVPDPETGYENVFVSSLLYDDRGYLFIGTEGGLSILDLKTEQFQVINENHNALAHIREIGDLLLDSSDQIWAATRVGLYRFPADKIDFAYDALFPERSLTIYRQNTTTITNGELPGNYVTTVFEDRDANIWIGTHGDGLVKFEKVVGGDFKSRVYTVNDGLSNNVIYSIEQDKAGFLWVSTDYGLSRLCLDSDEIDHFLTDDGLLSNQFYWTASNMSSDGELFFGSISGVNYFYPCGFPQYLFEPEVAITSFRVFNEILNVGDRRNGRTVLNQTLSKTTEISLSYKDNIFSIEFSALDFLNPRKVKYAYQLENVDRDWVEVSSDQRVATYSNLKGGQYLFRVRATNSEGEWISHERQLLIIVRPPFWQTTWFLLLMVLCVIIGVSFYMKHHTRRLLLEKSKLETMVKERTAQIEEQNSFMKAQAEELKEVNTTLQKRKELIEGQKKELEEKNVEIVNQRDRLIALNKEIEEINQSRLRFFTNISHEFRTPLTLIISPIERLLKEIHLPGIANDLLQSVQRNARRLNLLIDQLLMFRRIETGNLRVRIVNENVETFVKEVFHAFENLANQREINFELRFKLQNPVCWFDPEKVENILYNLLSNAFKYTPHKGKIELIVAEETVMKDDKPFNSLSIEVNDTGKGIGENEIEKIFNRFYRGENDARTKGSGIGLSLTKELVEALNGSIMVTKNGKSGSRFIVTLPIEKEDFPGAEVNEIPVFDMIDLNNRVQVIYDNISEKEPFNYELSDVDNEEETILVVEDNNELALFIANALSSNYRVILAANGKIGYELARKHSPDLVISDVMMPEMDGIEMCRQIKNNLYTSHIPVIMLSAKALLEDQLQGIQTGADDYVSKPFNLDILKAKVSNVIESRRRLRSKFANSNEINIDKKETETLDDKFLARAYEVMEEAYSNPEFSVEMFADQMFVSRSLLYKKLKALVDFSPNDFITVFRLKKSLPMLLSKELSINEVAYSIGFNDPKYFSRVFKKFYKKSPSEYVG
ncbi:hybrid sensor histidine kinase/response regulator transcription factor [Alkalitalea saponilacus]|nr:two-component regulator propeller domain-containing protein [Alkalitalea saponilacus]ASB48740.1 histidine kinase [Alkalitalea saponilacus]